MKEKNDNWRSLFSPILMALSICAIVLFIGTPRLFNSTAPSTSLMSEISDATIRPRCVPPDGFVAVETMQDFLAIADDLSGKYFLCKSIDFNNQVVSPMGSWTNRFNGVLNGNNKTLRRVQVTGDGHRVGIFDTIGINGYVSDLVIENSIAINTKDNCDPVNGVACGRAGLVAGHSDGKLVNVHVTGISLVEGHRSVGGLIGSNYGRIEKSSVTGTTITAQGYAGGIAGINYQPYYQSQGLILDSFAHVDVSVTTHSVGGIAGSNGQAGRIQSTYAASSNIQGEVAGIIAGRNYGRILQGNVLNGVIDRSYGEEIGLPLIGSEGPYSSILGSEVFPLEVLTAVPVPVVPNLYNSWDFQAIWSHEVSGKLPVHR